MEDTFKDIDIKMNYVVSQEHVPGIGRAIRTIKGTIISLYHLLPYNSIPKVMIRYILKDVVKCLNMFPTKGGVF